ncbi:MAG: hypothetical protein GX114_10085, partial [Clostridiales bacterium]|nr:hypothetical protein [Clostridiales bacterium]
TVILLAIQTGITTNVVHAEDTDSDVYFFGYWWGEKYPPERLIPNRITDLVSIKDVAAGGRYSLFLLDNGEVYVYDLGQESLTKPLIKIEGLPKAEAVESGQYHCMVLSKSGDVYLLDHNMLWELVSGDYDERPTCEKIDDLANVKAIACGYNHNLMLLENGEVYSFGENHRGQLGLGDKVNRSNPTKIPGLSNVKAISAGGHHSLVLLDSGEVYSFGSGTMGQLGHGDRDDRLTPLKIESLGNVKAISAGWEHSLVLLENGEVYGFGENLNSQLGIVYIDLKNSILDIEQSHLVPTRITDCVNEKLGFENMEPLPRIKAVAAGGEHSLLLAENGSIYGLGRDGKGQLGSFGRDFDIKLQHTSRARIPTKILGLNNVTNIYAGEWYSFAMTGTSIVHDTTSVSILTNADKAEALKPLGVFIGTEKGFELERPATRMEAAVMLTRLLGKEEQAREENNPHTFEDVPEWGGFYVGYLYKNGLAAGVSESQFGSEGKCTAQMYVTFVLRALGYSDKEGADFTYADALDFAVQIELISAGQRDEWSSREFIRDDLAGISYDALRQEIKEGRQTLSEKLFGEDVLE